MNARERIVALTRSFEERDAGLAGRDPLGFEGYDAQLKRAQAETGLDDACVWGIADIDGRRCALVVFDFAFMGGSMGTVAGEKVARAFDAARADSLPVVTVTASGGARMQEGMWSLVQMAKTVEARRRHGDAGLAHVTLITSPTTGGVYASFASLADVIYAEPEATVGFAGPRVVEEMTGVRPDGDSHTAEFAYAHGLIDAIVAREDQPRAIALALGSLTQKRDLIHSREPIHVAPGEAPATDAWQRLQQVRGSAWPKAPAILDVLLDEAIELRGDRTGTSDDPSVVVRAGNVLGTELNVVAIGQNASGDGRIRPEGFRKAIRAIEMAGRLGLPVVTLIDTRGADPSPSSEGAGVAVAIARTFEAMLASDSPTMAILTGEGGSGGALAMAPADRVLAWESTVFSVIAPEAAATILYRDPGRGPDLAERLRITVPDLVELGLVDHVIPEPVGGVSKNPLVAVQMLASGVVEELNGLLALARRRRLKQREKRWRTIARPGQVHRAGSSGDRRRGR